ncbi:unnamed protein product [Lactuca saligna]|uniref:Mediator of RNA polymerase II transcription subunit 19 n=1 Tax=Lactuca saligna TaxID=75948 RepID=A0AA36EKX2_LACSI|nr:unnamed protein product [Lactuca saligna]
MDPESKRFGRGPKELTGGVDLINYYKLFPHYELFCKKSLPLSISDAHHLRNVVGDTVIRKGEGMELNQLIENENSSFSKSRVTNTRIQPFDLNALRDAFYLRETFPIDLPPSEKGIPTQVGISKSESKDKEKKHKKHKDKNKEHKKHKHRSKHHDFGAENLKKPNEKKRKHDGDEDLNGIHRHKNSKHKMDRFVKLIKNYPKSNRISLRRFYTSSCMKVW